MFEIATFSKDDLDMAVCWANRYHPILTEATIQVAEGYEVGTWRDYRVLAEEALNDYFIPVPGTDVPVCFVDPDAASKLVVTRLKDQGARVARKAEAGAGYDISFGDDRAKAVRIDRKLNLARRIFDCADFEGKPSNCFVRAGYVPSNAEARRTASGGYVRDTGRFFSVTVPKYTINTSGDPHLHDRIEAAFERHGTTPCVRHAWRAKEDLISRGGEVIEGTFRSLFMGAKELGETRFGRLLKIRNKPTGDTELTKLASFTVAGADRFYSYVDVVRRSMDPRGWGVEEYEAACFAGDEEALNAPLFFNHYGRPLLVPAARVEFRKVVRLAGIKCGERDAWMHLGRHDQVIRALDEIEDMDVPEFIKDRLRDDLATYMGWAGKEEMLKIYGARHFAARRAKWTSDFQAGRGEVARPTSSFRTAPALQSAFEGW
ncbi:hypothetical protein [Sphingomonas corticis]|uniref:Uncharacterized protein n=1 Tax=Sphingomonas corticis TaxID=2722791 RepID=A0ABX1CVW2_9SPHN|nr:hypothetical protein [Sphingomonas corticis]NJR80057.1 hypothetical protein [Sphingomonas corticis]